MDITQIYVQTVVNVIEPSAQDHHHFRPGSLEDKIRIKQGMIHSHVLAMFHCPTHGNKIVHHVAACNCTGLSLQELDEIVRETYTDFLQPTEQRLLITGFPLFTITQLRNMVLSEMHEYFYFPPDYEKTCNANFLKVCNYTMVLGEILEHLDGDGHREAIGYVISSPPFVMDVHYTIMPMVSFPAIAWAQG